MFRPLLALLLCLITAPALLNAAPLDSQVEAMISKGAAARAVWGVYAVDAETGRELADVNGRRLFVPASNRKLVSTAMVAKRYQPTTRLATELRAASVTAGTVNGDLVLVATGDPSWRPELIGRSGVSRLSELADQVQKAGIRRVTGRLVIDTSRYTDPAPIPPGWRWDDFDTSYGSWTSVLMANANMVGVSIRPASVGNPPVTSFPIPIEPFRIVNQASTSATGSASTLNLVRSLDGRTVTLRGNMPANAQPVGPAVPLADAHEVWGRLFEYYLQQKDISIGGGLQFRAVPAGDRGNTVVASVEGATIEQMVTLANKESDNHMAEALYLLASINAYGVGSYRGAKRAESDFWTKMSVDTREIMMGDGCGLTRENAITPHAMTALLRDMRSNGWFVKSLPISGRDGTLRYRLSKDGMAGRVEAKTGTLDGVSALSGYVTTNSGRKVCFSIMANNYTSSASSIRQTIDEIVVLLAR